MYELLIERQNYRCYNYSFLIFSSKLIFQYILSLQLLMTKTKLYHHGNIAENCKSIDDQLS